MIEKLIAAAVLSIGASAIGKLRAKGKPAEAPFDFAKYFRDIGDRAVILRQLQGLPGFTITRLAKEEGMTATWCKNRAELETFLADKYSKKG